MAQSNFVCVCFALMGAFSYFSQETMSVLTMLACALLAFDAFLGTAIFIAHNQEDIYKELGIYGEYKRSQYNIKRLNCEGHITNLNLEYRSQQYMV